MGFWSVQWKKKITPQRVEISILFFIKEAYVDPCDANMENIYWFKGVQ